MSGSSSEAARSAWYTRLPGSDLADLVWDGDVDDGLPPWSVASAGSAVLDPGRCVGQPAGQLVDRPLCFAGPDLCVVVEVGRDARRAVRGRLVPTTAGQRPSEMALRLETARPAGAQGLAGREFVRRVELRPDAAGRFELASLPRGPMRLVVTRPGRPVVATSWVLVD